MSALVRNSCLALAILVTSCSVDLEVPEGSRISCKTPGDCPSGWRCSDTLGWCVRADQAEQPGPKLASPAVPTEPVLRSGASTRLVFTTDQDLGRPPAAAVDVGIGAGAFTLLSYEGRTYTVQYTAQGSEPQGSDRAVTLELVGMEGARSTVTAGSLRFDFQPPALVGQPSVAPLVLARGARASIRFQTSEPVREPTVLVGGVPASPLSSTDGTDHTFEYVVATTTEARAAIVASIVDLAGNASTVQVGEVTLDFDPPEVASASLTYDPGPENPLAQVLRATAGTTIVLSVVSSEPLDEGRTPTLTLECGGVDACRAAPATSFNRSSALFQVKVPAGVPDAVCVPSVRWSDVAGNDGDAGFDDPKIETKTSLPKLRVGQELVRFVRSPDGSYASEELAPGFVVPQGPYFALAPAEPLEAVANLPAAAFGMDGARLRRVRLWSSATKALLLGAAEPLVDAAGAVTGWPRVQLASANIPTLYATGIDDAGNESTPERIEHAEWVATPRLPDSGAGAHQLLTVPVAGAGRSSGRPAVLAVSSPPEALLVRAQGEWQRRSPVSLPSARRYPTAVYDPERAKIVMFGGLSLEGFAFFDETWVFDGVWEQRSPTTRPSPRLLPAAVYDSVRGRSVLFGGFGARGVLDETWEWDGANWAMRVASVRPSPRLGHALAYDSKRGRVVLFGGADGFGGANLRDTWEWDGSTWTERLPSGPIPPALSLHAMAYDPVRGKVLLFGGENTDDGIDMSDTWEWDGTSWLKLPVSGPSARTGHGLAYDSVRRRIVLFGGVSGSDVLSDTWEWDGTRWEQRVVAGPSGRAHFAMSFHAGRGRTLVFSGMGVDAEQGWWEWDGTAWEHRGVPASPGGRDWTVMVFDAGRGRTVLFGGYGGPTDPDRSRETWEWDGRDWQQRNPAVSPPGRSLHAMAYDSTRARVVLFGGEGGGAFLSDTWEWNGTDWLPRPAAGTVPPARVQHALAYDSSRARVVLFGGVTAGGSQILQDTWEWDGATWVERTPAGPLPPARSFHALSYDPVRRRVVLFGGSSASNSFSDTWEWDGTAWLQRTPAGALPSARWGHSMAFDSAQGRTLLFGGVDEPATWEWDGTEWSLAAEVSPPAGLHQGLAFDSLRGRAVLYGGIGLLSGMFEETWELDSSAGRAPAVQFDASWLSAGFEPSAVTGLRVRAHCAGRFAPYGAGDVGAQLYGWATGPTALSEGGWTRLASNALGPSATAPVVPLGRPSLDWTAADSSVAQAFLLQRSRQSSFQCRPAGSSGVGDAEVALQHLEVRVRYLTPP